MDSIPGRSTRHQPSSLLGLPQDLRIEIATCVGATSEQLLADLRSLCGTCSTMRRVCGHSDVGRRLSIRGYEMRFLGCGTPLLTKHSLLCWVVSRIWRLFPLRNQSLLHRTQGIQWSPARCRGWARCGGLSIHHLALQRQWWCRRQRHREGVHEAGRGRRQYDVVGMAEQQGVSAFAREGRVCAPLLDLMHLGWTAAASGIGARRSAVRRHRRRLRRGKRMASNFSVLQRRL
jgi:hypothetical protein